VGGVWRHERYPSQDGPIHQPVPRARQVEAVRFLNENAFTTPTYFLDTAILRRIEPTGFVDRVRVRQSALLNTLFQDQRLSRLVEQEGTLGRGAAYTLSDLFDDVRGGVFSELRAAAPAIDAYRRNLQNSFLDQMDRLLNTPLAPPQQGGGFGGGFGGPPPPPRPADARAQARVALLEVQRGARAALPKTTDRATRAHLTDLVARAERMLNPR
jgi:hypothetical protein